MATLLDCSTGRGYLARIKADGGQSYPPPDYFGPKAVYLGEDMPAISELRHYLRIITSIMPRVESQRRAPLSEELKQRLQNQLLAYRLRSMPAVIASEFNVVGLSPEANAIAAALGKCVAGAPELQAEIVSLLTPFSDHQISEHLDDFGMLVIGAALTLCHQSKNQVLVGKSPPNSIAFKRTVVKGCCSAPKRSVTGCGRPASLSGDWARPATDSSWTWPLGLSSTTSPTLTVV